MWIGWLQMVHLNSSNCSNFNVKYVNASVGEDHLEWTVRGHLDISYP